MAKKRIHSKRKGKVGELELAAFLTDRGFPARRGQQYKGGIGSPDVVCEALEGYHFEVKRVEAGNLYDWMAQAKHDAGSNKVPVVAHRKNSQEWVAIIPFDDFLKLVGGW